MTAPAIPSEIPTTLTAGDTWLWSQSLADFPADEYTLSYRLLTDGATPAAYTFTATADNTNHAITVAAATTAAYAAGKYQWHAYATHTSNGKRYTVATGYLTILPNFAVSVGDPRSQVKQTLDAINATLYGKASKDQIGYKIGDIEISKMTPDMLLRWRGAYQQLYREELLAAAGADDIERSYVEFTSP